MQTLCLFILCHSLHSFRPKDMRRENAGILSQRGETRKMAGVRELGMCASCFSATKLETANLKCGNFFYMRCSVFEEEEETLGWKSILGSLSTRHLCQHGRQIAEEKLGRHRRRWRDLILLSMSRHCYITATLLVDSILFSLFLQFPKL